MQSPPFLLTSIYIPRKFERKMSDFLLKIPLKSENWSNNLVINLSLSLVWSDLKQFRTGIIHFAMEVVVKILFIYLFIYFP